MVCVLENPQDHGIHSYRHEAFRTGTTGDGFACSFSVGSYVESLAKSLPLEGFGDRDQCWLEGH